MSVLDTLNAASPATRTVRLIVDKALHSRWHELNAELAAAADQDLKEASLAASSARKVIEQMEAIRDQVESSEVDFAFEQLDWAEYIGLQAEHPPRKDKLVDRFNGYNVATFPPALIRASCASVTGHDGDTRQVEEIPEETWTSLFKSFNARQVEDLVAGARAVNDRETSVPPSARSLLGSQDSGASLAQPSPGTSPRSGSAGGSRRTSARSNTAKKAVSSGSSPG